MFILFVISLHCCTHEVILKYYYGVLKYRVLYGCIHTVHNGDSPSIYTLRRVPWQLEGAVILRMECQVHLDIEQTHTNG